MTLFFVLLSLSGVVVFFIAIVRSRKEYEENWLWNWLSSCACQMTARGNGWIERWLLVQ